MNGIKMSGGLGNQMFQYAFIATANPGKLFFLEKEGDPIELYKYFKLKKNIFYFIDSCFFDHAGYKLLFSHYLRSFFYTIIKKLFISKAIHISNTDKPVVHSGAGVLFEGYFQSPLYFENQEIEVCKFFELKSRVKKAYDKQYGFLHQKAKKVVVHIRKKDYIRLGHLNLGGDDLSLPLKYYHQIIKEIHSPQNYYIFISDEPELIEREFDYIENKYISKDNAIIDFQHMLYADICLIANSTFSWWAAFLNKKRNKVIHCPKRFLGFRTTNEYPVNIYPLDWIQTEVLYK